MHLKYTTEFNSYFKRLKRSEQDLVMHTLDHFQDDPHHPDLGNHALAKHLIGLRAITADHDLRIVFREKDNYTEVRLLRVGPHEDAYE